MDLILGTAGHIDHGKTSLIRALTGIDTDRLPEEKRRGITIELGFAHLELGSLRLGIVDVPGHERFVRQMLAGATGMDMVMLVVAADDSVKQQTREHLDVLQYLQIPAGIVVLTKCDAANKEWIALVEQEVRELVQGTFLQDAPIVRTSAQTGAGLEQLRQVLLATAQQLEHGDRAGRRYLPFRLAIDRCFAVAGHGTVVTGSVWSGQVQVGDSLLLAPDGGEVRVRGLHNHDKSVEQIERGQRGAVNLVGVHHQDIRRGQELCERDAYPQTQRVTVQLHLLPQMTAPLKSRATVRLHLGTDEWVTRVQFSDTQPLAPGDTCVAQMILPRPAVVAWGQPFVIRQVSPQRTMGGGIVLSPDLPAWRLMTPRAHAHLEKLRHSDPESRISAAIYALGTRPWTEKSLLALAGASPDQVTAALKSLRQKRQLQEITASSTRKAWMHVDLLVDLAERLENYLQRAHERQPRRSLLDRMALLEKFPGHVDPAVLQAALQRMVQQGSMRLTATGIGLTRHGPQLSANERKLYDLLVQRFEQAGVEPPTIAECRAAAPHNREAVADLLALAISEGDLVKVNSEIFLHANVEQTIREQLREPLQNGLTVSQIRELLGTSRKFAVPICEYLDKNGFTQRQGDVRTLKG